MSSALRIAISIGIVLVVTFLAFLGLQGCTPKQAQYIAAADQFATAVTRDVCTFIATIEGPDAGPTWVRAVCSMFDAKTGAPLAGQVVHVTMPLEAWQAMMASPARHRTPRADSGIVQVSSEKEGGSDARNN